MNLETKRNILAWLVFLGTIFIPYVDEIWITANMKESGAREQIKCNQFPDSCWIKTLNRQKG